MTTRWFERPLRISNDLKRRDFDPYRVDAERITSSWLLVALMLVALVVGPAIV